MVHVMLYPEVRRLLRQDLQDGLFRPDIGPLDVFRGFPYLHAVIKEAMRVDLAMTRFRFARVSTEVIEYGPYKIPAGTAISTTNTCAHLDPTVFPDPSLFQPDRWLQPDSARLEKYWTAFGQGRYHCVGSKLALLTMHYAVARIFSESELLTDLDMETMNRSGVLDFFPSRSCAALNVSVKAL
ncbi:hypothetical protein FKW77_009363 [Venturia effusa]|uniref:Cytochrome P450 n=1 Tax=Venturia effusa TaxID=50376 RepID=A0A517KX91_9PEZI|nr:hypothetical protein FKW77_009363 [Venturia effusa]